MTQESYIKNVKTLLKRADAEVYRDAMEAEQLLKIALKIASDNKDLTLLLEVRLTEVLIAYKNNANTDKYDALLAIVKEAKKDNMMFILAKAYYLLGQINMRWELYNNASRFYEQALLYAKEGNHPSLEIEILNAQGVLAITLRKYKEARLLFDTSLIILKTHDMKMFLPLIHSNIGSVYFYEDNLDLAWKELEKASAMLNSKHSKEIWGNIYFLNGQYKRRIGKYEEAIDELEQGIHCYNSVNRICLSAPLYKEISEIYLNTHDVSRALHLYVEAFEIAESFGSHKESRFFTGNLAEIYEKLKMEKEAFNHYKLYWKMNASLEEELLYHQIRAIEF